MNSKDLKDVDYAALGLVALFPSILHEQLDQGQGLLLFSLCFLVAGYLWWSLKQVWRWNWLSRLVVVLLMVFIMSVADVGRSTQILYSIFLVTVLFFSSSQNRWGRSMRCLCGIFISAALFTSLPIEFGLPAAVLAILVFVGGLLSVWSGMSLNASIIWFTKRSFRKETVFLIIFVTGVTAIGLGQAQSYANRRLAQSGLASSLTPGSIKSLALSSELAMKIYFPVEPASDASSIYIRATSLDQSFGLDWLPGTSKILKDVTPVSDDLEYSVSLAPRYLEFTPVIDYGVSVFDRVAHGRHVSPRDNGTFLGGAYSIGWRHYNAYSRSTPVHGLSFEGDVSLFAVGGHVDQQVKKLALELAARPSSLSMFLKNLSAHFKNAGFVYSLQLPDGVKNLNMFLFDTKVGFCEHYAAASATLGRLAGYQARVVTGFQGGFWDESSRTLYVRDLDAHAWTEFWDSNQGRWVRYDPITYVAPMRLERGAAYFLRSKGYLIPDDGEFASQLWFTRIQVELDDFLSGFNSKLSEKVGQTVIENGEELALLGAFGLTLSYIFLVYRRHSRTRQHPEIEVMTALHKFFQRRQLSRENGEPISVWLRRCAMHYDDETKLRILAFIESHSRFCHGRIRLDEDLGAMYRLSKIIMRSKKRADQRRE